MQKLVLYETEGNYLEIMQRGKSQQLGQSEVYLQGTHSLTFLVLSCRDIFNSLPKCITKNNFLLQTTNTHLKTRSQSYGEQKKCFFTYVSRSFQLNASGHIVTSSCSLCFFRLSAVLCFENFSWCDDTSKATKWNEKNTKTISIQTQQRCDDELAKKKMKMKENNLNTIKS